MTSLNDIHLINVDYRGHLRYPRVFERGTLIGTGAGASVFCAALVLWCWPERPIAIFPFAIIAIALIVVNFFDQLAARRVSQRALGRVPADARSVLIAEESEAAEIVTRFEARLTRSTYKTTNIAWVAILVLEAVS